MSFAGLEAPIIFGDFGIVGSAALANLPPNALLRAENVAYEAAELVPVLGSLPYNALPISGFPSIVGLLDWFPAPATQRLIAMTDNGQILRDDGGGTFGIVMASGLDVGPSPVMAVAGAEETGNPRKAFLVCRGNKVQVIDGDAAVTRDIGANAPAEWTGATQPRHLFAHAARLWGLFEDTAYFSATTDHEHFTDAPNGSGTKLVGAGVGERLESGLPFKEDLFLWKWPRGIFLYDTRGATVDTWVLTELTRGVGIAGPRARDVGGNEIIFLSEIGHPHLLSSVRANDVLASDLVAANSLDDWWRENVSRDQTALARAVVTYYQDRQEFHCALPAIGATQNTLRVIVDMKKPGTPRIYTAPKDVCQSIITRIGPSRVEQLVGGDNAGQVWTLDEENRTKGGVAFTCTFQTPNDDFAWVEPRLRTRRKNLAFLELIGSPTGNFNLEVDTYLDGVFGETITFNLGGTGAQLGSFVLGVDQLGTSGPLSLQRRMRGSCRRLSLVGRFTCNSSSFRIGGFIVYFTVGGHSPVGAA